MSESRKKEELDLEAALMPSWAQPGAPSRSYSDYQSREPGSRDRRDRRPPRRPESRGGGYPREPGGRPGKPLRQQAPARGPRKDPLPRRQAHRRRSPEEILASLPGLKVSFSIRADRAQSLAKQIRIQSRAFPLFDIAALILKRPEKFDITTALDPQGRGLPVGEQWLCTLDDSLWLSREKAIDHVLSRHFGMFYQEEKTAADPPKGNFGFVAQCGLSGALLGPPNHHGYQESVRRLHQKRFSHLRIEDYRARIKVIRDPDMVQKWVEEQSWKVEYRPNGEEGEALGSWKAVREHFQEHLLGQALRSGESLTFNAGAGLKSPDPKVQELVRFHIERATRFPLQLASQLGQLFARHGLQIFKAKGAALHVSVARPRKLDPDRNPLSDRIRSLLEFIEANPGCTRRQLIVSLAPPDPSASEGEQGTAAPPTEDQKILFADLRWLIHEGHVVEFSNGSIEAAGSLQRSGGAPGPRAKTKAKAGRPANARGQDPDLGKTGEAGRADSGKPQGEKAEAESAETIGTIEGEPAEAREREPDLAKAEEADQAKEQKTGWADSGEPQGEKAEAESAETIGTSEGEPAEAREREPDLAKAEVADQAKEQETGRADSGEPQGEKAEAESAETIGTSGGEPAEAREREPDLAKAEVADQAEEQETGRADSGEPQGEKAEAESAETSGTSEGEPAEAKDLAEADAGETAVPGDAHPR